MTVEKNVKIFETIFIKDNDEYFMLLYRTTISSFFWKGITVLRL